ncbi:ribosome maturation factor RimM [Agrilactobacillus fermenti]|uniref:ribosome maturation factor RimM n=1 Tax=Agrilactobacillus fermenti TaxID=2586909 RepID=UPI001E61021A|nr:ribosome maturation factor RimM [Agrilactobacillus fermenti]MCD2256240.1 ribosome maturation factor RimM [Agrilactobacillus fermenti]
MAYFKVGKIVNTQGIKGEVKIVSHTDFPETRFQPGAELAILFQKQYLPVTIEKSRIQKGLPIVKFTEFNDINAVEKFKGSELYIAAEKRPADELASGEFYYHQIIGAQVIDAQTKEVYGPITEILSPGANDVWVVNSAKYGEILIPYIKSVILKVDVTQQQIWVDLPEGLIDREN